jgi:hypothetical protein
MILDRERWRSSFTTPAFTNITMPKAVLEEMLAQNSLGAYFNTRIRDIYRCARVR